MRTVNLRGLFEASHSGHAAIRSMEGLRGFAVALVFLVHYITLVQPWIKDTDSLARQAAVVRSLGNVGVDLFFVLSGYLIYGSLLARPRAYWSFLRRRCERIYPTFTVVFLIYLALSLLFPDRSKLPEGTWDLIRTLCENYLLLPGMFAIEPIITVAWSLSYEMFFYLTIPLTIALLGMARWPWPARLVWFALLAVLVWLFPLFFGGHVRFIMFAAGCLLFELVRLGGGRYLDPLGLAGLALVLVHVDLFGLLGIYGGLRFLILGVAFVLLCLACFSVDGVCRRLFSWTPLRWLGNISYSFYLIHGLALNFFFLVLKRSFPPDGEGVVVFWSGLPLAFAFAFLASAILFALVEKPFSLAPATVPRNFIGLPKRRFREGLAHS